MAKKKTGMATKFFLGLTEKTFRVAQTIALGVAVVGTTAALGAQYLEQFLEHQKQAASAIGSEAFQKGKDVVKNAWDGFRGIFGQKNDAPAPEAVQAPKPTVDNFKPDFDLVSVAAEGTVYAPWLAYLALGQAAEWTQSAEHNATFKQDLSKALGRPKVTARARASLRGQKSKALVNPVQARITDIFLQGLYVGCIGAAGVFAASNVGGYLLDAAGNVFAHGTNNFSGSLLDPLLSEKALPMYSALLGAAAVNIGRNQLQSGNADHRIGDDFADALKSHDKFKQEIRIAANGGTVRHSKSLGALEQFAHISLSFGFRAAQAFFLCFFLSQIIGTAFTVGVKDLATEFPEYGPSLIEDGSIFKNLAGLLGFGVAAELVQSREMTRQVRARTIGQMQKDSAFRSRVRSALAL